MPRTRSSSSWCTRNGLPATATSDLGTPFVRGRSRLASPPARMATGRSRGKPSSIGEPINRDPPFPVTVHSPAEKLGAFEVESQPDFLQARLAHGVAQPSLVFRV